MKATNEKLKCEICGIKLTKENTVYIYKDICVNPNYSNFTNTFCVKCAKENHLIDDWSE